MEPRNRATILYPLTIPTYKQETSQHFFVLSIIVSALAVLGIIGTDAFGYRLLPGVLFIFLLGSYLYEFNTGDQADKRYYGIILKFSYILIVIVAIIISYTTYINLHYTFEVILGLLIGLPLLYTASQVKEKIPMDKLLGDISYPLYLSNFLTIWTVPHIGMYGQDGHILVVIITALTLSLFVHWFFDGPIQRYRKNLQKNIRHKTEIKLNQTEP